MAALPDAKRARLAQDEAIVVPRDVVARIRNAIAAPGPQDTASGSGRTLILSWNIDGIDDAGDRDRMLRCLAVAEHIARLQPAVVMLQEAVPPQLELLLAPQVLGEHYEVVCPDNPRMPYYCVMLLHKRRVRRIAQPKTTHFESSRMGRHFLAVDIVVDQQNHAALTLITTHLESTKSEKHERVAQLVEVLIAAASCAATPRTVVIAGDLNVRDDEVLAARKAARVRSSGVDNIVDAWIWCGSPKNKEFTWDTSVNKNLGVAFSSRCRFDRCFFATPKVTYGKGVEKSFGDPNEDGRVQQASHWVASGLELVGQSKVDGLGRFPSDHWGIQVAWSLPTFHKPNGENQKVSAEIGQTPDIIIPKESTQELSDEERAKRRALAAARAEQRQKELSVRGVGDVKKLNRTAEVASPARSVAVASNAGTDRNAEACSIVAGDVEEESEESMLARAIAMSLEAPSTDTVAAESLGSGSKASNVGSAFERLGVKSSGSSKTVTIDLDE